MRRARWLAPWKDSLVKPVIYHCITRVVDRQYHFGPDEKEWLRALMRMQENFSGCKVLAYCLMSNHIHLLLEVPPRPLDGISDAVLLERLGALYSEATVAEVAAELKLAHESENPIAVEKIHARYEYRMHDLGEFMKGWLQRFTQWFNRSHERTGGLWEDKFKSVIVEDGHAAKTMAAYIDLNPVRAGMAVDPAEYRWSSYGEAIGGGPKGNGKKARAGLVRALRMHRGTPADAQHWAGDVEVEYRKILLEGAVEKTEERVVRKSDGKEQVETKVLRKGAARECRGEGVGENPGKAVGNARSKDAGEANEPSGAMPGHVMMRHRIRYFTDGVVIGSRGFVDEVFARCRNRLGDRRKTGARKLRGAAAEVGGDKLWSLRDLKKQV